MIQTGCVNPVSSKEYRNRSKKNTTKKGEGPKNFALFHLYFESSHKLQAPFS